LATRSAAGDDRSSLSSFEAVERTSQVAGVVAILLVVASTASLLPAMRTARVDPAEMLKAA
jgi:ABC-type lipoprotein release transport system permease subunit